MKKTLSLTGLALAVAVVFSHFTAGQVMAGPCYCYSGAPPYVWVCGNDCGDFGGDDEMEDDLEPGLPCCDVFGDSVLCGMACGGSGICTGAHWRVFLDNPPYQVANSGVFLPGDEDVIGQPPGRVDFLPFESFGYTDWVGDDERHFCYDDQDKVWSLDITRAATEEAYDEANWCTFSSSWGSRMCRDFTSLLEAPTGFYPPLLYTLGGAQPGSLTMSLMRTVKINSIAGCYTTSVYGYYGRCSNDGSSMDAHGSLSNVYCYASSNMLTHDMYTGAGVVNPISLWAQINNTTVTRTVQFTPREAGYYTFGVTAAATSGTGLDESYITYNGVQVNSDIYFGPEKVNVPQNITVRASAVGRVANNVVLRVYKCSWDNQGVHTYPENIGTKVAPEQTIIGSYPDRVTSAFYNGTGGRYDFNWYFRPNFSGRTYVRMYNGHNGAEDTRTNFSLKSRTSGSATWSGGNDPGFSLSNIMNNYFSLEASRTKEYWLNINGFAKSGGSYFTIVNGFRPFDTSAEYDTFYLPVKGAMNGTITGSVYQVQPDGSCSGTTAVTGTNWTVECDTGPGGSFVPAQKSGSNYACCADASCSSTEVVQDTYTVRLTGLGMDWAPASCSTSTKVVTMTGMLNEVEPFFIRGGADPWFQAVDGDVASGEGISCALPAGSYLLSPNGANTSGVVVYGPGGSLSLGEAGGLISEEGWSAQSVLKPKGLGGDKFDSIKQLLGNPNPETGGFPTSNLNSSQHDGVHYYVGDITILGNSNLNSNKNVVILVNGMVTIGTENASDNTQISVDEGGFLAIIASGAIRFSSRIDHVEGVFITDG